MKNLHLLLILSVSVCLIAFLTSCSDNSSNNKSFITGNNGGAEPVNPDNEDTPVPDTLTPIETGNIDTYTGTYSGVEIMPNGSTIEVDWKVFIFDAKATLEKVDDDTLKLKYNFQYDGYAVGHYNDIEGYDVDISNIAIVEKDENIIQVSARNQGEISTFSLKKEKDRIEKIDDGKLIVKNDLCNATSGASEETSCFTPEGAQMLIGSYKIAEMTIDCGSGTQRTGGGI